VSSPESSVNGAWSGNAWKVPVGAGAFRSQNALVARKKARKPLRPLIMDKERGVACSKLVRLGALDKPRSGGAETRQAWRELASAPWEIRRLSQLAAGRTG
jgi:hypothetical protein